MKTFRHAPLLPALAAALLVSGSALAQRSGTSYLSYVGSEVSLVSRADDDSTARPSTPILAGDRLVTGPSSRAEAILADGNVLRVDVRTSLRFDRMARTFESEDERNALTVERGAVVLEHLLDTSREEATRIDTEDATVLVPDRGLVRVDAGRRGTEVYVVSGKAELNARSGRATLHAGEYAFVSGSEEIEVDAVDAPRDRFTRFVEERRERGRSAPGNRYVSSDYAYDYAVSDFDSSGSWVYSADSGSYCWRPTVAEDWRPYTSGYWRWTPAGLTWVPYESWGWMTFHFGSWLWDTSFGWCWSPGTVYSPAWVYWCYTPRYVGWCPIGYYAGYRPWHGHGGPHGYPRLHGAAEPVRFDPRGWSYLPVDRVGGRFDPRRDLTTVDRAGFRPGERGYVSSSPLRIDRGTGSPSSAVREAVRRAPQALDPASSRGSREDVLTPILRRDATLGPGPRTELERSMTRAADRPVAVDTLVSGGSREAGVSRGRGTWGGAAAPPAAPASSPRGSDPRDGWRSGSTAPSQGPVRAATGEGTGTRRDVEPATSRERTVRGDDGWRAPAAAPAEIHGRREAAPGRDRVGFSPRADAPARSGETHASRSTGPSRRPESSTAPASPSWRETAPAPRVERGAPRSEPAPRGGGMREETRRSYEPPPRPYTAPAPRAEAPSRSFGSPAPRVEAPSSRGFSSPAPRAAPPSAPPSGGGSGREGHPRR